MESPSQRFRKKESFILSAALDAVDPEILVRKIFELNSGILRAGKEALNLSNFTKIHILGAGKGVSFFFKGLKKILGSRISGGLIISLEENSFSDNIVRFSPGDHPIPGKNSLKSGSLLKEYVKNICEKDLVISLITGGASSMILRPPSGIDPGNVSRLNKVLINSGAEIGEINCVRKHLSTLKGGMLAELIYPAKTVTLALSDTLSSSPGDIGSGMFSGDPTSFSDALEVLNKYNLKAKAGKTVTSYFEAGIKGDVPETPKPGDNIFKNYTFLLAGDNLTALKAAGKKADQLGFKTQILKPGDSGDVSIAAKKYAKKIKNIIKNRDPCLPPVLLLAGGELTVKVKGDGKGGRNQEFMLAILRELKDIKHPFHISSIGTDGIDGPTDAAGAWINEQTIKKTGEDPEAFIDRYLKNNDSYRFFEKTGNLIKTGATRTNVMDIRMFFIA